tara:strand:+ start:2419 stop:2844 length:426 start_codon:yes stop_codon:yes gene_type:complete
MTIKNFEEHLKIWHDFRISLELSKDPIQDTIDYYNQKKSVELLNADPYSQETWPTPWELLQENIYCPFVKILAICYTLQLTDCLSHHDFEIHITLDENNDTLYLLFVGDRVIGFEENTYVHKNQISNNLHSQIKYMMPPLN